MTAETEDYKVFDVVTTVEKHELVLSSFQDLTNPNCDEISHNNQASDQESSYVDIIEADDQKSIDLTEADDHKSVDVTEVDDQKSADLTETDDRKSSYVDVTEADDQESIPPESNTTVDVDVDDDDAQNEKLDIVNEELNEPCIDEYEFPPLVQGSRNRIQVCFANSLEEHNTNTKSWVDVMKNPYKPLAVEVKPRIIPSFSGSKSGVVVHRLETLKTLNGASVEPAEEPPILPIYVQNRVHRVVSKPANVELKQETTNRVDRVVSKPANIELKQETTAENVTSNDKMQKKKSTDKNKKATNEGATESVLRNGFLVLSVSDEVQQNENVEEMRMKDKLKGQHRLEELAKVNEAEQEAKGREKRLRKKGKKKIAAIHDINNCETAGVEISEEIEVKRVRSEKPRLSTRQSKAKSIPSPLCKPNKSICWQSMWVHSICIVIVVLLWLRIM